MAKTIHQMCVGCKTNYIYSKIRWLGLRFRQHCSFQIIYLHFANLFMTHGRHSSDNYCGYRIGLRQPRNGKSFHINNSNFSCCNIIAAFSVF